MDYPYSFYASPWDVDLSAFENALKVHEIKFQKVYLDDLFDNFEYIFESEFDMMAADEILLDS